MPKPAPGRWILFLLALGFASVACGHEPAPAPPPAGSGGSGGGGGRPRPGPTAGTGGEPTGGSAGTGGGAGSGGGAGAGGGGGSPGGGGGAPADAAPASDAAAAPAGPMNYGGVGELVLIPVQYTAQPVPPLVAPECPDDPTAGFAEYRDSFVVQRPSNLAAKDRFSYEDGIYTFFVNSNDKSHKPNNTTAPRTEARYSDISTGEHIWSADVKLDAPLSKTCIMQIHNVIGAIAVYERVVDGRMFNLSTGKTILDNAYDKWFNLKVAFNTQNRQVRTYINNCLKETSTAPSGTPFWYFKHGVYTCDSGTCRSHYKNIHLYQKGSTDKFNTKSTYP
jgi:hypothetical protein